MSANPSFRKWSFFALAVALTLCPRVEVRATVNAGAMPAPPVWSAQPSTVIDAQERTFRNGAVTLTGTLYTPDIEGPIPAVIVLHAASSPTRDNPLYRHLIEMLPLLKIAVFVFDRRGSGASGGNLENSDYTTLADDGIAALRMLSQDKRIDPKRIGFWGLSQGGWLSLLSASRSPQAAFAISISAPMTTPDVQMNFAIANILRIKGFSQADIDQAITARTAVDDFQRGKRDRASAQKILDAAATKPWFGHIYMDKTFKNPDQSRWAKEMRHDPLATLERVRQPALVIYGSEDPWVPVQTSVERLRASSARHPNVELAVIAGADHAMATSVSAADQIDPVLSAREAPQSAEYFGLLGAWLAKQGFSCPIASSADGPSKITAAADRAFRPILEKYDVPGIVVAVTVDGHQYFFGYGVASKERNTPVTKDTVFEIGSVSKTFTATLASYAQTLDKISLADHPGKYMPQLRHSPIDEATLLNLGTYTAGGLPLQFPAAVINNPEMAIYFQQWKPSAAPGAQRRYSNPSIGLLGHITGLAMNRNFADLVETELFPKLGLTHSYIRVPESEMDNYAWGYDKTNKPIRMNPGVFDAETYGVKSTAADMIHFLEINIRPEHLETPIRRAVEATHIGYFKIGEMVQGLGWEQYPYPITLDRLLAGNSGTMMMEANTAAQLTPPHTPSERTLFNKTGSTNGFGAYVAFVPEKKIGIVMLANKNFPIPVRITAAHAVVEQLSSEVP